MVKEHQLRTRLLRPNRPHLDPHRRSLSSLARRGDLQKDLHAGGALHGHLHQCAAAAELPRQCGQCKQMWSRSRRCSGKCLRGQSSSSCQCQSSRGRNRSHRRRCNRRSCSCSRNRSRSCECLEIQRTRPTSRSGSDVGGDQLSRIRRRRRNRRPLLHHLHQLPFQLLQRCLSQQRIQNPLGRCLSLRQLHLEKLWSCEKSACSGSCINLRSRTPWRRAGPSTFSEGLLLLPKRCSLQRSRSPRRWSNLRSLRQQQTSALVPLFAKPKENW
mmetsp:Transcript_99078/g.190160  ORF Transcript_99078/g.190160 Transcript_99078/m.190160 type:complete len:271 (-) Transcript_99078:2651-3463(-)